MIFQIQTFTSASYCLPPSDVYWMVNSARDRIAVPLPTLEQDSSSARLSWGKKGRGGSQLVTTAESQTAHCSKLKIMTVPVQDCCTILRVSCGTAVNHITKVEHRGTGQHTKSWSCTHDIQRATAIHCFCEPCCSFLRKLYPQMMEACQSST